MSSRSQDLVTIWYHLTLPSTNTHGSAHQDLSGERWASVLKTPQLQDGWRNTRWAIRVEDPKKAWLVFEWETTDKLENFQRTDDYGLFWKELVALLEAPPTIYHIYLLSGNNMGQGFIIPSFLSPGPSYEILTLFFPTNISETAKHSLESTYGIKSFTTVFGNMPSHEGTGQEPLLETDRGWVEEEMIWKGEAVKGFVFLFRWRHLKAEKRFKREEKWIRRSSEDGELPLAIDCFFEEMRGLGMMGFDSAHGEFIKPRG